VIPLTSPDDVPEEYDPDDYEFPDEQDYPSPDWKP
jgi:hypothetical protein